MILHNMTSLWLLRLWRSGIQLSSTVKFLIVALSPIEAAPPPQT